LLLPPDGFSRVSRAALIGWGSLFVLFLIYAAFNSGEFLILDYANLMIHEVGHPAFSWAGYYTTILGGTLMQLIVPIACTLVFIRRGETTAVAATAFWTFENLLYVAAYMADCRDDPRYRLSAPMKATGRSSSRTGASSSMT
jgi:hypothetical protein